MAHETTGGEQPGSNLDVAPPWLAALPWPLNVMDFEASSLEHDSYPIEVGLARWAAPGQPVLVWSTLIRPAGEWTRRGHWSALSERVHGISKEDLFASGLPPGQVASALNAALGPGGVAWCDGGAYDAHWAGALFKAASAEPTFALGEWGRVLALLNPDAHGRHKAWLEQTPAPHRAGADAARLLLALAHAAALAPIATAVQGFTMP